MQVQEARQSNHAVSCWVPILRQSYLKIAILKSNYFKVPNTWPKAGFAFSYFQKRILTLTESRNGRVLPTSQIMTLYLLLSPNLVACLGSQAPNYISQKEKVLGSTHKKSEGSVNSHRHECVSLNLSPSLPLLLGEWDSLFTRRSLSKTVYILLNREYFIGVDILNSNW